MMTTREKMLGIRGVDTASTDQDHYDPGPPDDQAVVYTVWRLSSGKTQAIEGYEPPEARLGSARYVTVTPGGKPVRVCPHCKGGAWRGGAACKLCRGEGVLRPCNSTYVAAEFAEKLTRHAGRVL